MSEMPHSREYYRSLFSPEDNNETPEDSHAKDRREAWDCSDEEGQRVLWSIAETVGMQTGDPERGIYKFSVLVQLKEWLKEQPDHIDVIEKKIAADITSGQEINAARLQILGEIEQQRSAVFVDDELAKTLELHARQFGPETQQQLRNLIRLNTPEFNLILHKILDFLHTHAVTVQDHTEREIEEQLYPDGYSGFFIEFYHLLKAELPKIRNYLVAEHIKDIIETLEAATSEKPGALHGVAGGTSDEMIYTFSRVDEAYANRLRLGIHESYPIVSPVLPIAPGYLGLYRQGKLRAVYRDSPRTLKDVREEEQEYIATNHPDDEYIYDELNAPQRLAGRYRDPSNKLKKLQHVWDFEKHLKAEGRQFYYDLSRLDTAELHPMLIGDLYTRNQEYLHQKGKQKNESQPVETMEFLRLLFANAIISQDQLYGYMNLTKLHMRKKIEDDFGFDIAQLDFPTQRNFLLFLERRDIKNVEAVKAFATAFGERGLQTFLSLEQHADMGEKILAIAETYPQEEARALFDKYGELVEAAHRVQDYLRDVFRADQHYSEAATEKIVTRLMRRGRDLLLAYAEKPRGEHSIVDELERYRVDLLVFANSFKALSQMERQDATPLEFRYIAETEFITRAVPDLAPGEQEEMIQMFVDNRRSDGYPAELITATQEKFQQYLKQPGTFYLLRHKGAIAAFIRFSPGDKDRHVHADSLNVRSELRGSSLGSAVLKSTLDQYVNEGYVIDAEAYTKNPMLPHYIDDFGFRVVGQPWNYPGTNEPFVTLERSAPSSAKPTEE